MAKFYAVEAYLNHSDDYELVGIFSKEDEANQFAEELRKSGRCAGVVSPQHLEMPVILEILVRDRLRELAEPIRAIAVGMGLQMKKEKDLFKRELAAWRDRFPEFYFRSMDDCIERRS